jgi:predicted glycoside hydrolase/deacetylase ChbG (UPF0249 family)
MMGCQRLLIVNADDFGQSSGINRGIIGAHQYGIVPSEIEMGPRLRAGQAQLSSIDLNTSLL